MQIKSEHLSRTRNKWSVNIYTETLYAQTFGPELTPIWSLSCDLLLCAHYTYHCPSALPAQSYPQKHTLKKINSSAIRHEPAQRNLFFFCTVLYGESDRERGVGLENTNQSGVFIKP